MKNLQKPFFPFNKKKQVLSKGIKEKCVSKMTLQVHLERKWKVSGHGRVDLAFLNTSHVYNFTYLF